MKSAFNVFLAGLASLVLVACSGGGSISEDGGGGGTTPPDPTIEVSLAISNTDITAAAPATLTATVADSTGAVKAGELVTFNLNDAQMGTFDPAVGTALTDSSGVATILLRTASVEGAGSVSGSISTGESDTIGFNMAGDGGDATGGAQVVLNLTDSNGNLIESINSITPGKLTAQVTGISKPVIVTFSTTKGELPIDTAVTRDGVATVDIYAGNSLGAGTVSAELSSGEKGEAIVVIGATNVLMGSGEPFESGKAAVSIGTLSAGGTATVTVLIQDEEGNPFNQPVEVNFASTCSSASTPKAEISSPVVAVNGVATSTYLAKGCQGEDPINVTANAGGQNLSATGAITVLSADVGSIVFQSAEPELIGILGTGSDESSIVKFKVLDTNGNPVSNKLVDFSLNTNVGGIVLNPTSATTNELGVVQTVVNSGTVSTSVRVTAVVNGSDPVISSQSSQLVVSTGIADQDSFSLSAEILNAEGWTTDGVEVLVTARLADAFNNPVRDGTAVNFITEGGDIEDSCTTLNGACSVRWESQQPRPEGHFFGDGHTYHGHEPQVIPFMGQPFGGRATVSAYAIGEESFPDSNGNGRFDAEEYDQFLNGKNISGEPYDLADAYEDFNEDGLFNPQQGYGNTYSCATTDGDPANDNSRCLASGDNEELIDFDSDGLFDVPDAVYNGVLCSAPAHDGCADGVNEEKSLYVRGSLVIVMSGSSAYGNITEVVDSDGNDNGDGTMTIVGKSTGRVSVIISDLHNQQMPAGSTVTFTATAGSVASSSTFEWPSSNHNGGSSFSAIVKGEDQPNAGSLIIEVETPLGLKTIVATIPINII
ncbi:hypothetical protein L2750_11145 [Shewanella submarina]|uniref:Big-1 domain-containing protein n=1 Tax=Shewanella submarina TaxID=2016376 RepID=A0ABV7GB44_9GAMM|nr:hypothetical protein [Shewanella submarina]MCL1037707.1 hypothetical protein [Shewanella submarina]